MKRIATLALVLGVLMSIFLSCGQKKTKEQFTAEANRYERDENFKEAIRVMDEAVNSYPEQGFADSLLFRMGQLYSNNLSDFEMSIASHKRLIEKFPQSTISAQSLFLIGYHYANSLQDTANARIYYERFLKKYPDHELASSVKWELDHLGQDINEIEFLKSEPSQASPSQPPSSNP
ncbi:MAG: tetratricopeptide repeat protein [candidate division KSB1 bacterium]|nr:tetratricopeptide repeat protein [candidate division KSB1 bacterium]MDZ7319869.1 tetratricopeptide repeat protein [candidate division KSB1 bacterium]MDZ7340277.1 tetratricopeptide repeat protein [candidate division KSB1 bacterium]